jgi:protein SCO1/2
MNRLLYNELPKVERFRIGSDYRVLTVSFDKADTPEAAAEFAHRVGIPAELRAGWRHAVVKNRQTDVDALAGSVGFRYFWSNADKTFLHPNVLVFLTPEGRVARYLYGTRLDARAIQLALIDADWGRIAEGASVIDMLTGVCFSYNYAEGKYQPNYPLLIGVGSLLFGIFLLAFGAFVFRRKLGGASHVQ